MFTGLIEELGTLSSFQKNEGGGRLTIDADIVTSSMSAGDSIAVNGVCLTALEISRRSFAADLSAETLQRTTLGSLRVGSRTNLERAATPLTRLGGHLVQGHVDVRGAFDSAEGSGGFWTVRIRFPDEIARYFVEKGSVCVEGISLTIAVLDKNFFEIAVIPKTWEMTNLSTLSPGDAVNLEADVIAKYVERLISAS